ncbi:MAG: hypothetical protein ACYC5N_09870, partial [Endomicrobiales bacterium]
MYNETNCVSLTKALREVLRARPELVSASTMNTLENLIKAQGSNESALRELFAAVNDILKANPGLVRASTVGAVGEAVYKGKVSRATTGTAGFLLCNIIFARNDLAERSLALLEDLMQKEELDDRASRAVAEAILNVTAVNDGIISPSTVAALESVLGRETVSMETCQAASAAVREIARKRWQLIKKGSLAWTMLYLPDRVSWHPLPHYKVYNSDYFRIATFDMSPEERYSIGLTAYRLLNRLDLKASDENIEKTVRYILAERERYADTSVFGPGISVVNILHQEKDFDLEHIVSFEQSAEGGEIVSFKGSTRHEETIRKKTEALAHIASSRGALTVYFGGHGTREHLWLHSGQPGSKNPNYSQSISFGELGDALTARGDLSRVTVLVDACYSYDFCVNLSRYLALKGNAGLPVLVSSNNMERTSRLNFFTRGMRSARKTGPVTLGDVFEAEKKAFEYQDAAVLAPAHRETQESFFGAKLPVELSPRGYTELAPGGPGSHQDLPAYYRLPSGVSEVGMMPALWEGVVQRLQGLRLNGRRLVPDRLIAALGGLEELFFSALTVGGLSAGLSLIGVDPGIGLAAASTVSFLLFMAGHAKGTYELTGQGLTRAPPTAGRLAVIAALGISLRLIFAACLAASLPLGASVLAAVASHAVFNSVLSPLIFRAM